MLMRGCTRPNGPAETGSARHRPSTRARYDAVVLTGPIRLEHNLAPAAFMWLWAKYVTGSNPEKHCTYSIQGKYSKRLSAHNELLGQSPRLTLDEEPAGTYSAIYVCGVAREAYRKHLNYPHNLHTAILPRPGVTDRFKFERWSMSVE